MPPERLPHSARRAPLSHNRADPMRVSAHASATLSVVAFRVITVVCTRTQLLRAPNQLMVATHYTRKCMQAPITRARVAIANPKCDKRCRCLCASVHEDIFNLFPIVRKASKSSHEYKTHARMRADEENELLLVWTLREWVEHDGNSSVRSKLIYGNCSVSVSVWVSVGCM